MIAHPERGARRALHRLVGAARWPVELVGDLDALAAAVDADAIAVVDAGLALAAPALRSRPARAWIAVPGDGSAPAEPETVDALLAAGWTHVAAHPMPLLAEELLATLGKLIRGDAFGLEKYLAWGADLHGRTLEDARDREPAVAALAADLAALGLPERTGALAAVIADELLANALHAAPAGADGRDAVTLRWGTDARYLALEVGDRWGSLDDAAVPARLVSAARSQDGSGGMGLPLVFACSTQLVIGTAPSARTEVIALLDLRHRPTELGRSTSFHAFRRAPRRGCSDIV